MSTTFKGRFGKQLAVWLVILVGLSFLLFKMNEIRPGHLGQMVFLGGRFSFALLGSAAFVAITIVHILMRPILVIDRVGARVKRDFNRFEVRWDDVEAILSFSPPKEAPKLGFKLLAGSQGANPSRRAQTGFDQILENEWGVPLYEIEKAMRLAIGGPDPDWPLSPSQEKDWLTKPQQGFGTRTSDPIAQ